MGRALLDQHIEQEFEEWCYEQGHDGVQGWNYSMDGGETCKFGDEK